MQDLLAPIFHLVGDVKEPISQSAPNHSLLLLREKFSSCEDWCFWQKEHVSINYVLSLQYCNITWRVISQSKTAVSGYALHRVTARSGVASGEEREALEYKEVEILAIGLGEIFDGLVVEGKGEVLGKLWQPKLGPN